MKHFRKTEGRAIDNLLRAEMARRGGTGEVCREFDPDLANAYVEHRLTAGERALYERHISECAGCRRGAVALGRLAAAEAKPFPARAPRPAAEVASGWLDRLRGVFPAPGLTRWAAAATAILVLAVSIPLLFLQKEAPETREQAEAKNVESSSAKEVAQAGVAEEARRQAGSIAANRVGEASGQPLAGPLRQRSQDERSESEINEAGGRALAKASPAEAAASPAPPRTETVEADLARAGARDEAGLNRVAALPTSEAPPAAPPPVAEEKLAQIDSEKALRLPDAGKDSTQSSVLRPGRIDGDQQAGKERTATIKSEERVASDEASSSSGFSSRRMAEGPARFRLADGSRDKARSRSLEELKVSGKRFYRINGIWTDKDYNPDKEMPLVPIIRNSDVYREVVAKRSGLKVFFTRFAENDYVIVVYKGTVYKLIPQESQK